MTIRRTLLAAFLVACSVVALGADPAALMRDRGTFSSDLESFRLVQLAQGLDRPWALAFLPDGDYLITERSGQLWRFDGTRFTRISGLPDIDPVGQGGLLDVVPDPDFARNSTIYLTYSGRYEFGLGTLVSRAELRGDRLRNVEELFRMNRSSNGGRHFGSRLVVGTDGMLYFTTGDRGQRDRSQDPEDHAGAVLRIAPDGSVPADNPFVNGGGAPEVYSYGHRNAQGMTVHPRTGEIWLHEHGPQGGDEINVVKRGANYGWPVITYGVNYGLGTPIGEGTERAGMEQPVLYWTPSIAPSGMAFYDGDAFPGWNQSVFAGALAGQHLRRVGLDGTTVTEEEILLRGEIGRVRDVRMGPDGFLYLLTDDANGGLYRLEPVR